jgi:Rrf2 family protein
MHFLTQASQYAISAIMTLAREPEGIAFPAAELAKPIHCPAAYLSQTLAKLIPCGIIGSKRGLNGGVMLARKTDEIFLYEIISCLDGESFFNSCFLGLKQCDDIEPCPFHSFWTQEREHIQEYLQTTSIADALDGTSPEWFEDHLKYNHPVRL